MKAIDHHLFQRNGYLYYRNSFPLQFQPIISKREIRLSLGTREVNTGRLYVAKLDIEIDALIHGVYSKLQQAQSHSDIADIETWIVQEIEVIKDRTGIQTRAKPNNLHLLSSYQSGAQAKGEMVFNELVDLYLKDCVMNSPKTIEHKRITYEMFQSICGNLPVPKIGRAEARQFKEIMIKAPANLTKLLNVKSYLDVIYQTQNLKAL